MTLHSQGKTSGFGRKKPAAPVARTSWLTRFSDARSAELADALRRISPPLENARD